MRALFDISVLLALFDFDHNWHDAAHDWRMKHDELGWASCPLTENGFARIVSQPSYSNPISIRSALSILSAQKSRPGHEFWPDDLSIANPEIFDHSRILGPNQITDIYLLALAVKNGGRLATFDRGIPLAAVRGAEPRHLVVI